MKSFSTTLVCLVISATAVAGEVTIPKQFQPNTRAVAADVNANFDAVKTAVDDNAQRVVVLEGAVDTAQAAIDENAQRVGALEGAIGLAGISVRVNGELVGRFVESGTGFLDVAVSAGGTELVAEAIGIANTRRIIGISSTGYFFDLQAADGDHPFLLEGELATGNRFFGSTDCTGTAYRVIQGDTGFLSVFQPGDGRPRPIKPWLARQGWVFASQDPNDVTPVWMVQRGAEVQTAALGSFLTFAFGLGEPFCVQMANLPGYDINNPLHVVHTVVLAEPNDPAVTGIDGRLGGELTVGL